MLRVAVFHTIDTIIHVVLLPFYRMRLFIVSRTSYTTRTLKSVLIRVHMILSMKHKPLRVRVVHYLAGL